MAASLTGRALAPGTATAEAIVLDEPLSFWGGLDPARGEVIEPRHPQRGVSLAGRVVVMAEGRGSSSSSSVLAEAARAGVAPAGILLGSPDLILAVGSAVADELYRVQIPVVVLERTDLARVRTGDRVAISGDGAVRGSWGAILAAPMPRSLEIVRFADAHADRAARLLADRQRHLRSEQPALPERWTDVVEARSRLDAVRAQDAVSGVAALDGERLAGFLI